MKKIKLYDIHGSSAIENFSRLLTPDHQYFYWDNKAFQSYAVGDIVFWICRAAGVALYTTIDAIGIKPAFQDGFNQVTDQGYDIAAKAQSADSYQVFYRFKVLEEVKIPAHWNYQAPKTFQYMNMALGLLEPQNKDADKRIDKINDLKRLFSSGTVQTLLDEALQHLNGGLIKPEHQVWFVAQGSTFKEGQGKRFLWAPEKDKNGYPKFYWDNVKKIQPGDFIFNYSEGAVRGISIATDEAHPAKNPETTSGWAEDGYRVEIALTEFSPAIRIHELIQHKSAFDRDLATVKNKPFATTGQVNQGYLYEFTPQAGRLIRDIYGRPFGVPAIDRFFDQVKSTATRPTSPVITEKALLQQVQAYMQAKGFQYTFDEVANFYLALRSKPFVILAGISGTGKTQLPRQLAAALGFSSEQVIQVPVRPDWADSTELLGYTALDGTFLPKSLTLAIQAAFAQPTRPFFFILDEMNLARVEHYFSDFLSVIETRAWTAGQITTDLMLRPETLRGARNAQEFQQLTWPSNLYLIGTVNMDETTHAFSRKVLDRANSIEMNTVDLNWTAKPSQTVAAFSGIDNSYFQTVYLQSTDLADADKLAIAEDMERLIAVNDILQQADLQFAYRLRDEVAFYLLLNKSFDLLAATTAFDFQLVQKVLPRIHGSSERIQKVLVALLNLLEHTTLPVIDFDFAMLEGAIDLDQLHYPRSSRKIVFMLQRYHEDRFTSFWL